MNETALKFGDNHATLEQGAVTVPRKELVIEHDTLMARIHQLRRLLELPPLLTGHQRREIARNANR